MESQYRLVIVCLDYVTIYVLCPNQLTNVFTEILTERYLLHLVRVIKVKAISQSHIKVLLGLLVFGVDMYSFVNYFFTILLVLAIRKMLNHIGKLLVQFILVFCVFALALNFQLYLYFTS